jgi:hypothetical protein
MDGKTGHEIVEALALTYTALERHETDCGAERLEEHSRADFARRFAEVSAQHRMR